MMKALIAPLLSTLLFTLFFVPGDAQELPGIQHRVAASLEQNWQEKLYVHTSKDVFLAGELVWFKVYFTDAENVPAASSKLAYIDLLDKDNRSLVQAKVALTNGGGGSIIIPATAANGVYRLRAYTNWMKNFGPGAFFEKQLTIINPARAPEISTPAGLGTRLQFFPEGGYLVNSLPVKVAFKATGKDGLGRPLTGAVINQRNDTVARFTTTRFGMGQFSFTPVAADTYKTVSHSGSEIIIQDLPAIKPLGYTLQVTDEDPLYVDVQLHTNLSTANAYLIVYNGKTISVAAEANFTVGTASFKVEKARLADGISHFTVFNSARQAVSERAYFKRPVRRLQLKADAGTALSGTRKKITVNIIAKNEKSRGQQADLSLSVYRADSLQSAPQATIESYLWLSSELRGPVESPEYYLENTTAASRLALDNLLLTQGWSRFKWEDAPAPAFNYLPEVNGHLVTGMLTDSAGHIAPGVSTYMGITGKRNQFYAAVSDSAGKFLFNTTDLYGTNELVVQTGSPADSSDHIRMVSPFSDRFAAAALPAFTLPPSARAALELHSLSSQVQNVYNGSFMQQFIDPGIDSSSFYGSLYKTYLLDDYVRFTTMEEVLREYVAEVNVTRSQKHYHLIVISSHGGLHDGNPLVLLDGVPFFSMDRVLAIDPLKVKRLELERERYFLGPATLEGILSFTTYKGDLAGALLDPHAVVLDYEGMQLQREFYSPDYEPEALASSRIPDFRTQLFWSANTRTTPEGTALVSFYTSDIPGKYIGVLQGLTPAGTPGTTWFTFEVKK